MSAEDEEEDEDDEEEDERGRLTDRYELRGRAVIGNGEREE